MKIRANSAKMKTSKAKEECRKVEMMKKCPCTYEPCDKKGKCCECLAYHLSMRELPACCFSYDVERSFDRSFEKFIEING